MILDVYYPIKTKTGKMAPGTKPCPMEWSDIKNKVLSTERQADLVRQIREGNKELKTSLASVDFMGRSGSSRSADSMTPTNLVMVDIDHFKGDVRKAYDEIVFRAESTLPTGWWIENAIVAYITPSLGMRLVFKAQDELHTIIDNINFFEEKLELGLYGDVDKGCTDLSRVSFLTTVDDLLYESAMLYTNVEPEFMSKEIITKPVEENESNKNSNTADCPIIAEDDAKRFEALEWRGTPVKAIIQKYVEVEGTPEGGEIHNYYNEMVKNFRCITDNNKRCLFHLLPRFGHTGEECWSQIKSICRVNTLSTLPKAFYFFLKDNGFYQPRANQKEKGIREYMMSEDVQEQLRLPYLPPIFRELIKTAPKDFVVPAINALMPMLGTLTSYVQAVYPYDGREHTTSFFSIIYAPPGTGKGFVERWQDLLFAEIKIRDYISSARENIYLSTLNMKSSNDKAPAAPHNSLRIIPPKNSEAEFLQKQKDNEGYHMFTFAAEMDSWAKGARAAGGNKDDMIRIAWDNGEYGQQFKAANTFKGTVRLYWNVLITGTIKQIEAYFKNVENGLVTRCCFTPIENQEFVAAPRWKQLSPKDLKAIEAFTKRCDEMSYEKPCEYNASDLVGLTENAEEFDKEVDWRFKFRPRIEVDMSWIMPTIDKFQEEQMNISLKDIDRARDVFRRRVGVRGFRLALLCTCLYKKPKKSDLEKCKEFVWWWMHQDIENMIKLWGAKYNEEADTAPNLTQRTVYSELSDTFTRNDIYAVCLRQGIKTQIRRIVHDWKKQGFIEAIDKETFKKVKK